MQQIDTRPGEPQHQILTGHINAGTGEEDRQFLIGDLNLAADEDAVLAKRTVLIPLTVAVG